MKNINHNPPVWQTLPFSLYNIDDLKNSDSNLFKFITRKMKVFWKKGSSQLAFYLTRLCTL